MTVDRTTCSGSREKATSTSKTRVALSPLGGVGAKPTREHRIRLRSRQLERLQFPWARGFRAAWRRCRAVICVATRHLSGSSQERSPDRHTL